MVIPNKYSKKPSVKVILTGGLGNQLFMLIAAIEIAIRKKSNVEAYSPKNSKGFKIHGSSVEALQFSIPIEFLNNLFSPKNFQIKIAKLNRKFRYLLIPFLSIISYYESPVLGYDFRTKFLRGNIVLKGYFQSYKYFRYVQSYLGNFEISVKNPTPKFLRLKKIIESSDNLIIHVRLGDYLNHKESIGVLDAGYYVNALKALTGHYKNIFVFSDDIGNASKMLSAYLPRNTTWINNDVLSPEESLILMSLGTFFILSNSSFGLSSALISKKCIEVIVPIKWFKNEKDPGCLIPPEWKRIDPMWLA